MSYLDFFPVPLGASTTVVLSLAVGLSMVGMAIAFVAAEAHSGTTRALTLAYGMSGLALATEVPFVFIYPEGAPLPWFARFPVFVTIAVAAFPLWLVRIAATSQATPLAMKWIMRCAWIHWTFDAAYLICGGLYADERLHHFYLSAGQPDFLTGITLWMFIVPNFISTIVLTLAGVILFTQPIDPAERRRILAFAVSFPFLGGVFTLPAGYNLLSGLVGQLIFLIGTMRFHIMQGERGQFMSRFLSPQVAQLVQRRGLAYTMQPQALDVTVVACDLRGFTQLSQVLRSQEVISLLSEYYEAAGQVVAEFGATIKDYAGDGILILVGAPVAMPDHGTKGLALARRLNSRVHEVIALRKGPEASLGLGIGVASGTVTVGAIGSSARMEYSAVGPAVNLASRLCSQAKDGEILVDARTAELVGNQGLESRGRITIKGMADADHYALASA